MDDSQTTQDTPGQQSEESKKNGESSPPPVQLVASASTGQIVQKPSKLRAFFRFIGILQASSVLVIFLGWLVLSSHGSPNSYDSGLILVLIIAVWTPVLGLLALVNLVGLPIYMVKRTLRGTGLVFSILSLVVSVAVLMYVAYAFTVMLDISSPI